MFSYRTTASDVLCFHAQNDFFFLSYTAVVLKCKLCSGLPLQLYLNKSWNYFYATFKNTHCSFFTDFVIVKIITYLSSKDNTIG